MPRRWTFSSGGALLCAPMVIVALALLGPTAAGAETPEAPAKALRAEIDSLRVLGRYSEARERTRELLTLRQAEPKTKPYDLVDAQWLLRTMELAAALPDSVRAELAWADSADQRVESLGQRGSCAEAIPIVQRQLEIRTRLLGRAHPDLVTSLNNLGYLLHNTGDYVGAELLYREALATSRELLGQEHPAVALSLNNLGTVLQATEDYAGAEPVYRDALAM